MVSLLIALCGKKESKEINYFALESACNVENGEIDRSCDGVKISRIRGIIIEASRKSLDVRASNNIIFKLTGLSNDNPDYLIDQPISFSGQLSIEGMLIKHYKIRYTKIEYIRHKSESEINTIKQKNYLKNNLENIKKQASSQCLNLALNYNNNLSCGMLTHYFYNLDGDVLYVDFNCKSTSTSGKEVSIHVRCKSKNGTTQLDSIR